MFKEIKKMLLVVAVAFTFVAITAISNVSVSNATEAALVTAINEDTVNDFGKFNGRLDKLIGNFENAGGCRNVKSDNVNAVIKLIKDILKAEILQTALVADSVAGLAGDDDDDAEEAGIIENLKTAGILTNMKLMRSRLVDVVALFSAAFELRDGEKICTGDADDSEGQEVINGLLKALVSGESVVDLASPRVKRERGDRRSGDE